MKEDILWFMQRTSEIEVDTMQSRQWRCLKLKKLYVKVERFLRKINEIEEYPLLVTS